MVREGAAGMESPPQPFQSPAPRPHLRRLCRVSTWCQPHGWVAGVGSEGLPRLRPARYLPPGLCLLCRAGMPGARASTPTGVAGGRITEQVFGARHPAVCPGRQQQWVKNSVPTQGTQKELLAPGLIPAQPQLLCISEEQADDGRPVCLFH